MKLGSDGYRNCGNDYIVAKYMDGETIRNITFIILKILPLL
jgi:hypothetical protein